MGELYDSLNKSWKTTCRILLGEEVGELKEYEDWLSEYCPKTIKRQSAISGKEVFLASDYSSKCEVISADEMREPKPLSINDIKDIDSIARAISEEWTYTGNRILGNSRFVERSDLVMDSNYVSDSVNIQQSTNIYKSFLVRLNSKNIFGSGWFGQTEFTIRLFGAFRCKRVFESHIMGDCNDAYFSNECMNSSELMFAFFQRNKHYVIGNVQLERDKYLELKKKLLSEVVDELKKNKKYPSLFAMVNGSKPMPKPSITVPKKSEQTDMNAIEKAFASTFRIMFKKEPGKIEQYENWLSADGMNIAPVKSAFGGNAYIPKHRDVEAISLMPKDRFVSLEEGLELAKIGIGADKMNSIAEISDQLGKIGYFCIEVKDGVNTNTIQSPLVYFTNNIYKGYDIVQSENIGVTSSAFSSKYIFGGYRTLNSEFCINCHNSLYLTRCFEVDTSTKCSDSLFCHNTEGLTDAMFCFNIKGKRQMIGNTQLTNEHYAKKKSELVEQLADEIVNNKKCRLSIFDIGGRK